MHHVPPPGRLPQQPSAPPSAWHLPRRLARAASPNKQHTLAAPLQGGCRAAGRLPWPSSHAPMRPMSVRCASTPVPMCALKSPNVGKLSSLTALAQRSCCALKGAGMAQAARQLAGAVSPGTREAAM